MIQTRSLAFIATICLSVVAVHAQFQVVHDAPNTSTTPKLTALILDDDHTVTHHWDSGQHIFRKYDTGGTLVWSKALAGNSTSLTNGDPAIAMSSDGAGGFRFVRHLGDTAIVLDPVTSMHSIAYSFHLCFLDGSGTVTMETLLKKTFILPTYIDPTHPSMDLALTSDNGLLFTFTTGDIFLTTEVIKISAAGTLEWSRSVGHDNGQPGFPIPTGSYDGYDTRVILSPTGQIYYTEVNGHNRNFRLAALDSNGDLLWMKHYVYGNITPSAQIFDIKADGAGNVHSVGSLITSVGRFHYFLRTNADGELDRGDLYRTPLSLRDGKLGIDSQGRRYHQGRITVPWTGIDSHGILLADTLGSPAQYMRRANQVVLPNNVFVMQQDMDLRDDRLALSGLLNHEHVDLAFTTRYETLSIFDTDQIASCMMDDTTLAHIPIPMNIMTTEVVTDAASIDVTATYSTEQFTSTFITIDPDPLETLCTFAGELLGQPIGIYETAFTETPLVRSSFLAHGSPIIVNDPHVRAVAVYDTQGKLMTASTLAGNRTISTTDWNTGVYVLRAMDSRNVLLRSQRIVLE